MPKSLLTATTSAAASSAFVVTGGSSGVNSRSPAHFTCPGLASSETGTVQKQNADESWSDYYVDGTLQQCTATNSGVVAYAPGIYRINKSATAAAVGVEVSTDGRP